MVTDSINVVSANRTRCYTYDEVAAELPEDTIPCELWEGQLVMSPTPSFYHQKVVLRFYSMLNEWVEKHDLGETITAPVDMVLSEHRVTQPDVAFIAKPRLGIIQRVIMGPVDLAAEVISLGTRNRDRIEKRDLYEQYGIQEYWIIDPEPRTVDVLFLNQSRYELVMRCGPGQVAASRLLQRFEVKTDAIFNR